MCGIVGSIGLNNSVDVVLNGLHLLEYRGYDSCGVTFIVNNSFKTIKSTNRISDLKEKINSNSNVALGHTRWATHGEVSLQNAHPHISSNGRLSLIHNGVITNYKELKEKYLENFNLKSQTDSEIILEALNIFLNQEDNILKSFDRFINEVEGSYALIILDNLNPDTMYIFKNKSPLLVSKKKDGYTVISDPCATYQEGDFFHQMEDKTYGVLTKDNFELYRNINSQIEPTFIEIKIDIPDLENNDYDTYMLKEIEEQPKVIQNIVDIYKSLTIDKNLIKTLLNSKQIYIIASGTSYHSGLICKRIIEHKLKINTEVHIGSEFGYEDVLYKEDACFIFISQSGETADSLLVFNKIKNKFPIISLTNAKGSQMDRNADYSLLLYAGKEFAVASTKAYVAQIAVMSILVHVCLNDDSIYQELLNIKEAQEDVIKNKHIFEELSQKLYKEKELFYIGKLVDYQISLEAALKIKEISYINVNAMPSGELKHGTISLIDESKKVISIITDEKISSHSRSSNDEVKARKGTVFTFSNLKTQQEGDYFVSKYYNSYGLNAIVDIIPHQYLSYFISLKLGNDIDKPRNLAKSVTVE